MADYVTAEVMKPTSARIANTDSKLNYLTNGHPVPLNRKERVMFTKEHAKMIIDAHEINLDEGEETELLEANNPELAEAYRELIDFASN